MSNPMQLPGTQLNYSSENSKIWLVLRQRTPKLLDIILWGQPSTCSYLWWFKMIFKCSIWNINLNVINVMKHGHKNKYQTSCIKKYCLSISAVGGHKQTLTSHWKLITPTRHLLLPIGLSESQLTDYIYSPEAPQLLPAGIISHSVLSPELQQCSQHNTLHLWSVLAVL